MGCVGSVTTWVRVIFFHQTSSGLIGAISMSGESSPNSWKGFSRVGMNGLAGFKGALVAPPKGLATGLANATFADGPVPVAAPIGAHLDGLHVARYSKRKRQKVKHSGLAFHVVSSKQHCIRLNVAVRDFAAWPGMAITSIAMSGRRWEWREWPRLLSCCWACDCFQ